MLGRIYKITNLINGKVYIGQTIQTVKDRWYRHLGNSKWGSQSESNMAIKRAIRKYGKENFTLETLEECDSLLLNDREIYYINYYDSYNKGYNCTRGGQGGAKPFKIKSDIDIKAITDLYLTGFSLREIAKEYKVDKGTIKNVLLNNSVSLRIRRNYKFTTEERQAIIEEVKSGISRKQIKDKYHISSSYLSQLLTGHRI